MDDVFRGGPRASWASRIEWRAVLLGAGLVMLLGFLFSVLSAAINSLVWAVVFSVLGYVLAGLVTGRVLPARSARDPALGGALVTGVLAAVQLIVGRAQLGNVRVGWLVLGWFVSVALAFGLTWAGALMGIALSRRRVRSRDQGIEPPPPGRPEIRPV